ncbi:MAG: HEAT repeat domain-containing protein [Planctomycetaceae bacterium]
MQSTARYSLDWIARKEMRRDAPPNRTARPPALFAVGLLIVSAGLGMAARADDAPAAARPAETPLEEVLKRLGKLEQELLELRIRSGKVPEDKSEQRVLTLLEAPYLGSLTYGAAGNQRFFAMRLLLVNLTDQPVKIARDDVQLVADEQTYAVKDPPARAGPLQLGQQQVQFSSLRMPKEVLVPVGGTASTWTTFIDLPPGQHVPRMILKIKLGDSPREIDVNAVQRDVLGLKVERLGPRGALGVATVGGTLNTVNVGSLVDEIDRLTQDKLVRLVIRFADGAVIFDPQLANWLTGYALNFGRNPPANEGPFPALPASLRELHVASLPKVNETVGLATAHPAFHAPNMGTGRIHKTDVEAMIAALYSAYEVIPRDELFAAVSAGSRLERAAALVGGGGRLSAEQLPVILKLADDDDPVIQQAALMALGHFGDEAAIEKLAGWGAKNVGDVSATAIAALAGSRFPPAHEAVLKLLANETPEGKKALIRILALYPRPVWSEAIYEFVKDGRAGLNVEALGALVQVGHPQLMSVLTQALRGGDAALSQAALGILVSRSDRESEQLALDYTLEKLKSGPPGPVMLQLVNRVKDPRALPLLVAQFDKEPNKSALIQTLALLGDGETGKFLTDKYVNLAGHERSEALKAVNQLDRPRFRQMAAKALQAGENAVIAVAIQGLLEDGGPDALKVLIESLQTSPSSFAWSQLCNALAQNGSPAARAALVQARDAGPAEKRNFAVGALQLLRQRSPGIQYVYAAQNLANQKKWKEALEQFDLALTLDPNLSDAYAERAHCLLQMEKPADAAKDFARAWDLDPYNSLALTGLCLAQVMVEGRHSEAVAKLEESRSKFLRQPTFLYNAACVYGRALELLQKDAPAANREALAAQYQSAALADLKAAIDSGFQDFDLMKTDPDLKPLQELPEFQKLLDRPDPAGEAKGGVKRAGRRR